MATYREEWERRPVVRRVHVRRDSEGRWFWYHQLCGKAASGSLDWNHAHLGARFHIQQGCGSGTPFGSHIEVHPDANTLRASWLCPGCRQYCASHTPCDCCWDEE